MLAIVSDTHGLLRSEVIEHLSHAEMIIHAGDVGSEEVLASLEAYAPVFAVQGNVDTRGPCSKLPQSQVVCWEGVRIFVTHQSSEVTPSGLKEIDLLVCGHSHKPFIGYLAGVRYLNPGSIGPLRFKLPVAMATLEYRESGISAQHIVLDDRGKKHDLGPGWIEPLKG